MEKVETFAVIDGCELKIDLILVEYISPILFTCIDQFNHMWIVSVYRHNATSIGGLIARTTSEKVIQLLSNQISIRDIFINDDGFVYTVNLTENKNNIEIEQWHVDNIAPNILPSPNIFMDADEGEFAEELAILNERTFDSILTMIGETSLL